MDLQSILADKKNVYYLNGVSEEQILQAEQTLGLVFATDYKNYLKQYALLSYNAHELTGICQSQRLNVVSSTLRERTDNENISDDMYLLESIGVENLTIWQNANGEIFEVEFKKMPHKIYNSLLEYIDKT